MFGYAFDLILGEIELAQHGVRSRWQGHVAQLVEGEVKFRERGERPLVARGVAFQVIVVEDENFEGREARELDEGSNVVHQVLPEGKGAQGREREKSWVDRLEPIGRQIHLA
jgi:hypothetical protein